MKKCFKCGIEKNKESFSKHSKRADGLQSSCKECSKQFSKKQYKEDINGHREKTKARKVETRKRNRKLVWEYLKTHPCIDCGETDPIVLEFDHLKDKTENISILSGRGVSEKTLLDEIAKCVVRCAHCHRRKTARDFGWYKDFMG
jgi:hypothetical protein